MEWFFRCFSGLLMVCVLISLAGTLKNLCSPRRSAPAVVVERSQKCFPLSNGFQRKDRQEYAVTFFLPQSQKTLSFTVSRSLYEAAPAGADGMLVWRGSWLCRFSPKSAVTAENR